MERLSFPLLFHCSHLLKENQGNKVLWSLLGVKIPEICFRILYLDMPCQKKTKKPHTLFKDWSYHYFTAAYPKI